MNNKLQEILEELKSVGSGKTFDALLPPLIYVLANSLLGLDIAITIAISFAFILGLIRIMRRQNWQYALGGLAGVLLASGLAYLTRSAASYFIPAILSSALLLGLALFSQAAGKPLAAWASHLSRGWPLKWFWRKDVKPAYIEVTWFWAAFFCMRLAVQVFLFQRGDALTIAWANTLLGWPVTVIILIITYIYGIWRLRRLGGPGVEEYKEGKQPPWKGQVRGF